LLEEAEKDVGMKDKTESDLGKKYNGLDFSSPPWFIYQ
jgi:hypothetical protein